MFSLFIKLLGSQNQTDRIETELIFHGVYRGTIECLPLERSRLWRTVQNHLVLIEYKLIIIPVQLKYAKEM